MGAAESVAYWRIRGKVQGVGFRWFVSRQARALAVTGWVRNMDSGEVCVLAAGPDSKLRELRALVQRGPAGAQVVAVEEIESPPPTPPATPFSIIG